MKHGWTLIIGLFVLSGCVADERSRSEDPEPMGDRGVDASSADGSIDRFDGAPPRPDLGQLDGAPVEPEPPEPEPIDPEPPAPEPVDQCDAVCDQMYGCFAAECAPLAGARFLDQLCEGLCDAPDRVQRQLLGLECPAYLDALSEFIPELPELCSDAPPPDECGAICAFLPTCQDQLDEESCLTFCRTFEAEQLACLDSATQAMRCNEAFQCFAEEPPPPEEDPEENCAAICQRENLCVRELCAPGTQQPGATQACFEACLADPPTAAEVRANGQRRCAEIVDGLRADSAFDERCSADGMQACAQLCADTVGDCMPRDACEMACQGWNETNLTCLRFSGGQCGIVQTCIDSPEAQPLCERACARWAECLGEACPPRILPPNLGESCAVGCLFDPPSAAEVAAYEQLACADVREQIYENNRELAPICEGDPEFHPTPDECVAFCERGLEDCIGIGGRDFCLGACATLDRAEYECALAAGQDCAAINACFVD